MAKRKRTKAKARRVPESANDVILINRFDCFCGKCIASQDRKAESCTECGAEFKRVTSWCVNVTWLQSSIMAERPDLEWIPFEEFARE